MARAARARQQRQASGGPLVRVARPQWADGRGEATVPLLLVMFASLLVYDASSNALGSSNGRFVSLVDTLNNVLEYRTGLPPPVGQRARALRVLVGSLLAKFLAQGVVSLALGEVPVLLKGPRHLLSFLFGFVLVWLCPGDMVYEVFRRSPAAKLLVAMTVALYKLRKALFAIEAAVLLGGAREEFALACVLVSIALDGNSAIRRLLLRLEHGAAGVRWDLRQDSRAALRVMTRMLLPDLALTAALFLENSVEARIAALMYFFWRQGLFQLLAQIHHAGMRAPLPEPEEDGPPSSSKSKVN